MLDEAGIVVPSHVLPRERFGWFKRLGRRWQGTERFAAIPRLR